MEKRCSSIKFSTIITKTENDGDSVYDINIFSCCKDIIINFAPIVMVDQKHIFSILNSNNVTDSLKQC